MTLYTENRLNQVMAFFTSVKEGQALAITNTDERDFTPSKLTLSRGLKQTMRDGANLFIHGREAKIRLDFSKVIRIAFNNGSSSQSLAVTTKKGTITFTKVKA